MACLILLGMQAGQTVHVLAASEPDRLPAQPAGIGRPAADRAWWRQWAATPEAAAAIKRAEKALAEPMGAFDAERYQDYATNGDRTRYQTQHGKRWGRLRDLVLGECLEGKRRFVAGIDETVRSLCADPSWLLPAHDRNNVVFKGGSPYVDLAVAMNGYQMATAAWLLEKELPPATLELMRSNVAQRLTGPVMAMIDGTASKEVVTNQWWARANHNWNAVCTAGAVGAILTTEPSPERRAKAIAWAVANADLFLTGFGKDGYCSEGLGYWNYGFGHFEVLAEVLRAHTGGALNLYQRPTLRAIATAPAKLEIEAGIFPAFADCALNVKPSRRLLDIARWRLDKQPLAGTASQVLAESPLLYQTMVELALGREARFGGGAGAARLALRDWLAESGVCVVRPLGSHGMAAAWKGGHNAEHHNHNDVGTTIVTWDGQQIIADPGAMVYRAETFGPQRYQLTTMSSFAHSVPVVAGTLQAEGAASRGKVIATDFSNKQDTVTMDLASAYPATGLKRLERQWTYQRDGAGVLVIEDRFEFAVPAAFGTALLGFGDWFQAAEPKDDRHPRFVIASTDGKAHLQVDVEFSTAGRWDACTIDNPGKPTASRLGLDMVEPTASGSIRLTIRPLKTTAKLDLTRLTSRSIPAKLADARRAPTR